MIRHVDSDEMIITVACVSFDPYTRELTYACAGHLPPLLIDDELHEVTRLDRASSPPLGVAEPQDITEQRVPIAGPATLVMYTDGLIERRGHNIDAGIELLANVFAQSENISIDSTLRVVVGALGPPADDVALLVAQADPRGGAVRGRDAGAARGAGRAAPAPQGLADAARGFRRATSARSSWPSARRATTRSSMPTTNARAMSGSASARTTARSGSRSRTAAAGSPTSASDDTRGRGHLDHAHADGRRDDRDDGAGDACRSRARARRVAVGLAEHDPPPLTAVAQRSLVR